MGALAVVPARGGSKGLPGKNLAEAGGRPLLAWTLEAAREARCVERVVVSTDCPRIAEAAGRMGAEVPFRRPSELARDETPGLPVLRHAVRWLEEHRGYAPEWVICLQPTSPLRIAADVEAAFEIAVARGADSVVSVTPARPHPFWAKRLDPDGRLAALDPSRGGSRRQDLPEAWMPNGAVYVARRAFLLEAESFLDGRCYAHPMPPERSLDVDEPFDLELAEWLLRRRASGGQHPAGRADRPGDVLELGRREAAGRG